MEGFKDKLKGLIFFGFENFDFDKVLYMPSELLRLSSESKIKLFIKGIRGLIIRLFFERSRYDICENDKSKVVFLFAKDTDRIDVYELFYSVVQQAQNADVIVRKQYSKWHFAINRIAFFPYVFSWLRTLGHKNIGIISKLVIVNNLLDILSFENSISPYRLQGKNLLVTFFDADPVHNYFTQKAKKQMVNTATLQHGVITAPDMSINNVDFAGLELLNSVSDYFLAWNRFTYREAIAAGLDADKIKIVGVSRCLNVSVPLCSNSNKTFGVILDGVYTSLINEHLIKIASKIAKLLKYKYVVKYHPEFGGDEYNYLFKEDDNFAGCIRRGSPISDYVQTVEFSIVANSTVLVELVCLSSFVFRFSKEGLFDKYRSLTVPSFNSLEEFLVLFNDKEQYLTLLKKELAPDIAFYSYRDFFKVFV